MLLENVHKRTVFTGQGFTSAHFQSDGLSQLQGANTGVKNIT